MLPQPSLFELGIFPSFDRSGSTILKSNGENAFLIRTWEANKLLTQLPWLKRQNTLGANIYIRPVGSLGTILIDDLSISTLNKMETDGITPCCVVETSPLNYQAWIRVSDSSIDPDLATATAKALAIRYDADLNSADWRHFGRLSGFTNRKPKHVNEVGRYPFVVLRSARKNIPQNLDLLESGKRQIELDEKRQISYRSLPAVERCDNAREYFTRTWNTISGSSQERNDSSKIDWIVVCNMLQQHYHDQEIYHAFVSCSPNLQVRKNGHVEDYVNRTINKAKSIVKTNQKLTNY